MTKLTISNSPNNLKICSVSDCERVNKALGFCDMHYQRFQKHNDPLQTGRIKQVCKVSECPTEQRGKKPYCNKHYQRWKKHGEPTILLTGKGMPAEVRFLRFVKKTETCWLWQGPKVQSGYGVITIDGKTVRAHRYSYFLHNNVWPEPYCLHSCDTPACVNPSHLRAGNNSDNQQDRWKRTGR